MWINEFDIEVVKINSDCVNFSDGCETDIKTVSVETIGISEELSYEKVHDFLNQPSGYQVLSNDRFAHSIHNNIFKFLEVLEKRYFIKTLSVIDNLSENDLFVPIKFEKDSVYRCTFEVDNNNNIVFESIPNFYIHDIIKYYKLQEEKVVMVDRSNWNIVSYNDYNNLNYIINYYKRLAFINLPENYEIQKESI